MSPTAALSCLGGVLIVTVGTGDRERQEESLFTPIMKSLQRSSWDRVILLPSTATVAEAQTIRERVGVGAVEILPLEREGDEFNPDACFSRFDRVLSDLIASGVAPESITIDFTRGTKAMSAAVVLAGARRQIGRLQYVVGGATDRRGSVVAGTERVVVIPTFRVDASFRLDSAAQLMRRGDFAAVLDLLPAPGGLLLSTWTEQMQEEAAAARTLAVFYAHWDRCDYMAALNAYPAPGNPPQPWPSFAPTPEVHRWISRLAEPVPPKPPEKAAWLRALLTDLIANGERRRRDLQLDDAFIRAYRVLELLGHARLLDRGIEPRTLAAAGRDPSLWDVWSDLQRRKDPLVPGFRRATRITGAEVDKRHRMPLTHGYRAAVGPDTSPLDALYEQMVNLVQADAGESGSPGLSIARWPEFRRR